MLQQGGASFQCQFSNIERTMVYQKRILLVDKIQSGKARYLSYCNVSAVPGNKVKRVHTLMAEAKGGGIFAISW